MNGSVLQRMVVVLCGSMVLTGCVSGIEGNHAAVNRRVRKVFAYQDVPAGKARDLRSPEAQRLLKTETEREIQRPAGGDLEPDLWKRAALIFDTDPLTNRSQKPDRIQILEPQIEGGPGHRAGNGWLWRSECQVAGIPHGRHRSS